MHQRELFRDEASRSHHGALRRRLCCFRGSEHECRLRPGKHLWVVAAQCEVRWRLPLRRQLPGGNTSDHRRVRSVRRQRRRAGPRSCHRDVHEVFRRHHLSRPDHLSPDHGSRDPRKGTIEVAMEPWPTCSDPATSSPTGVTALLEGKIVRGTQKFAGASGSLKVTNHVDPPSCGADGCRGAATDTWTGTLVVPDMEFDLTPPLLSGAAPSRSLRPGRRSSSASGTRSRRRTPSTGPCPRPASRPPVAASRSGGRRSPALRRTRARTSPPPRSLSRSSGAARPTAAATESWMTRSCLCEVGAAGIEPATSRV